MTTANGKDSTRTRKKSSPSLPSVVSTRSTPHTSFDFNADTTTFHHLTSEPIGISIYESSVANTATTSGFYAAKTVPYGESVTKDEHVGMSVGVGEFYCYKHETIEVIGDFTVVWDASGIFTMKMATPNTLSSWSAGVIFNELT
jgi:hypothetical protein